MKKYIVIALLFCNALITFAQDCQWDRFKADTDETTTLGVELTEAIDKNPDLIDAWEILDNANVDRSTRRNQEELKSVVEHLDEIKATKGGYKAWKAVKFGLDPNRVPFRSFSEMTEAEVQAFNHAISRHGSEFGLKWGKKEVLPQLVNDFNSVTSNIRKKGGFIGVQKVKYGIKGSGESTKLVDANVYNYIINDKTYYYWETIYGEFISAGLKTN